MYQPITDFQQVDDQLEFSLKTKMGCLILAGGQASRLGVDAPKGTFPITQVMHKSLFQVFLEKAKAACLRESSFLPIAMMTSPLNHEDTLHFLEQHHYFGYPKEHLFFFQQTMRPLEDRAGNSLSILGPDGNGSALSLFYQSGIWHQWKERGITCVHVIPVDNPLADPFDCKIEQGDADSVVQMILRISPEEKVGVVVQENDKIKIIEYTEFHNTSEQFKFANSGLFSFSMSFIERIQGIMLPLHRHSKTIKLNGEIKEIYKYESFIFDLLSFSEKTRLLLYPRGYVFSPLKNLNDVAIVQDALYQRDRRQYTLISGLIPPERIFELDQRFYYPTQKLVDKWKGRELPDNSYIEP